MQANLLTHSLSTVGRVMTLAGRLALRHWPVLLVLGAVGLGLNRLFIWLAVVASDHLPLAAVFIMPFAPLSLMSALIAMLWVMRPSLPILRSFSPTTDTSSVVHTHALLMGSLLIPFLTVYVSQGMLKDDTRSFIQDATLDESMNNFVATDFSRVIWGTGWWVVALVITVLLIRQVLGILQVGQKKFGWAIGVAYIEALWMVAFAAFLGSWTAGLKDWLTTRAVIAPLVDQAAAIEEWTQAQVPAIADSAYGLLTAAGALLGRFDDVVLVPVAWLSLGAIIFGTTLVATAPAQQAAKSDAAEQTPKQQVDPTPWLYRHTQALGAGLKGEAKNLVTSTTNPILGPIQTTLTALGKIAAAGVVPMVAICVIIMLASSAQLAVVYAARAIIGPLDPLVFLGIAPLVIQLGKLVYFFILMCLLAATVEEVVRAQVAASATPVDKAFAAAEAVTEARAAAPATTAEETAAAAPHGPVIPVRRAHPGS